MKGGLARQRFRAKQRYNRTVSQLDRLRAAGNTTEDIRAAGKNAWRELQGYNIVKDKQTGQWGYADGAAPMITPTGMQPTAPTGNAPITPKPITPTTTAAPAVPTPVSAPGPITPTGYNSAMRGRGYNSTYASRASGPAWSQVPVNVTNAGAYAPAAENPYFNAGANAAQRGRGTNANYAAQEKQPWWKSLFNREPAYGGKYNPTKKGAQRAPAYGGSYNPTVTNPATPTSVTPSTPATPSTYKDTYNPAWTSGGRRYMPPMATNFATLPLEETAGGGGYSGYYDSYYNYRRGGGGRRRGGYSSSRYVSPSKYEEPGWALGGQANWSFG